MLASWRTALAGRASAPADWVVIGDSITEGEGASTRGARWIERLQALLRAALPTPGVAGGEGYVPGQNISTSFSNGWSYSGNLSGNGTFGLGHRTVVLSGPDGAMSRAVTGTSITVAFTKANTTGSFRVLIDGVPAVTVDTAVGGTSTARDTGRTVVSLGARGAHTVRIEWAAGGQCFVNGMFVFDQDETSGIRLTESGQHGSSSAEWSPNTSSTAYVLADDLTLLNPDLVIISLGPNDMIQGRASGVFKTNMLAIVAQSRAAAPTAPIVLLAAYALAATYAEPWQNYVDKLREIAAADPTVTLIDLSATLPSAAATPYGLMSPDGVHPSDAGHDLIARTVAATLVPDGELPVGGTTGQVLAKTSAASGAVAWTNMVRVVRPGEDFNAKVASLVPGDVLLVTGRHVVTDALVAVSGTATAPITVVGDGTAVLEHSAGRTGLGYGLTVTGAYLHFADLIVQEAAKAVVVQGATAQHISFERVLGRRTKNEVFKARDFASYLYFVDCHAEDAGLGGSFGEGFYIGDASSNWPTPNVTPDTTGYVRLERCSTRGTLNDGFDLKEGAHHIVMRDCYTDRVLAVQGNAQGDSGMYSRADDVQIINYQVRGAPGDGLKLYDVTVNSIIYGRRMEVWGGLVEGAGGAGVASQSDDLKVFSNFAVAGTVTGGRTNVVGGGWTSQYDPATFVEQAWTSVAAAWHVDLPQHSASHGIGGIDPLTPAMIGAAPRLRALRTITASETLNSEDDIVLANTTAASIIATLPSAVDVAGEAFTLVKTGANALTIATTGGQTISGSTSEILSVTGGFRSVVSDGANWVIVGGKVDPVIATLADVGAGGTIAINASAAGVYRARLTGATATLAAPTQPIDGDVINLELYPTVACTLTIAAAIVPTGALTTSVALTAGKLWSAALRYRAATVPATSAAAWRLLAASPDN
ncbi:MAG: hypothetical protein H7Y15_09550 [Pseudonocardia sp.]|nr:hypothetical protein [Pseudonocardia sp.]